MYLSKQIMLYPAFGVYLTCCLTAIGICVSLSPFACWMCCWHMNIFSVLTIEGYVVWRSRNELRLILCATPSFLFGMSVFPKLQVRPTVPTASFIDTGSMAGGNRYWFDKRGSCRHHDFSCALLLSQQEKDRISAVSCWVPPLTSSWRCAELILSSPPSYYIVWPQGWLQGTRDAFFQIPIL